MKIRTVYEADDGSVHQTEEACRKYERHMRVCQRADLLIGERVSLSGGQWVQRSQHACLAAKRLLVELCRELWSAETFPVLQNDADHIHPRSGLGRIIDDGAPCCLQRAWGRLSCINWDSYREYDQPYFALNEDQATEEVT